MQHKLLQPWTSRPRLVFSVFLSVLIFFILPANLAEHGSIKFIISWNIGAIFYLLMSFQMMVASTHESMKKRAMAQNTGAILVLFMVFVSAVVCIWSTVTSLSVAKELHGLLKIEHIGLVSLTVFTSWLFTQVMFAQHYAHEYYFSVNHRLDGGLLFPGTPAPDYFDFLYFACVIGTSAQTADVSFTKGSMRRIGLAHCLLTFFFNTVLIALTINIGSGLI
jgi:uncharacterized membrane protein